MKISAQLKRENMGIVYILPWVIGFLVFQVYPLASSFYYSFTNYNITGIPVWVGLENYRTMFSKDALFYVSLSNTFKFVFMTLPMKIITALLIAVILSQKLKGIDFYRTLYYIPSIFGGSVAVSILWRFLFMDNGLINHILSAIHLPAVPWLSNPRIALFTLSLLGGVWQFGSSMVLFLAALKQVPEDLYEAARIDGAGKGHVFFRISLPMISPVLFFNILTGLVSTFQDFTGAFVITNGGPLHSTYLFALKLYDEAFNFYKMGYAGALSWVLFILIFIFTLIFFRFSSMAAYYEDGGKF